MLFCPIKLLLNCYSLNLNGRMVKCHLSTLMGKKRVKISDVATALGVHRNTISLLYNENARRIDVDVLNKLCVYFNCSISDLLEYQPGAKRKSKNT